MRGLGRPGLSLFVHLADHEKKIAAGARVRVAREPSGNETLLELQCGDVQAGEDTEIRHVWGREQTNSVEVPETQECIRSADGNDMKEDRAFGEGPRIEKVQP